MLAKATLACVLSIASVQGSAVIFWGVLFILKRAASFFLYPGPMHRAFTEMASKLDPTIVSLYGNP